MDGQMMLDLGEINPLREAAKIASTYWEQSKDKLRELFGQNPDDYDWTVSVRHEYCPYEIAGRWGFGAGPNTYFSAFLSSSFFSNHNYLTGQSLVKCSIVYAIPS